MDDPAYHDRTKWRKSDTADAVLRVVVPRNGRKMRELINEETDMNEIVSLITGVIE